jgi:hypothetical protein
LTGIVAKIKAAEWSDDHMKLLEMIVNEAWRSTRASEEAEGEYDDERLASRPSPSPSSTGTT